MNLMRHVQIFADSWRNESARRRISKRDWQNTDFLPAALEIAESPPSPAGRGVLWIIVAIAFVALIWATLSHVETVSIAEGRLVPSGRLRTVEAAQQGVIRAINVREGEHVTAGQSLVELDPTIANAQADSARTDLATAGLTRARDNALLSYSRGQSSSMTPPKGASPDAVDAERQLVGARIDEYLARRLSIQQRQAGAQATARAADAEINKLHRTLPLLKEALDLQEDLDRQGFGAKQKLLQQRQAFITAQSDVDAQFARKQEAVAQVASLGADLAQAREEFISKAAQERAEAEGVVATRGNVVREADQRTGMQVLRSPVSGTVQEIMVTNIGEVPEVGKPLITIVPDGEPLVVEALLLNQDAGFVHKGMSAVVKLEAYPFTRYGVLHGVVDRVSPDATVDQKRGLVFPVRLILNNSRLIIDGRPATLSPGMVASTEIITGSRRVIEFLWSPLAKAVQEAGRER